MSFERLACALVSKQTIPEKRACILSECVFLVFNIGILISACTVTGCDVCTEAGSCVQCASGRCYDSVGKTCEGMYS